jgi:hypothetical protein
MEALRTSFQNGADAVRRSVLEESAPAQVGTSGEGKKRSKIREGRFKTAARLEILLGRPQRLLGNLRR